SDADPQDGSVASTSGRGSEAGLAGRESGPDSGGERPGRGADSSAECFGAGCDSQSDAFGRIARNAVGGRFGSRGRWNRAGVESAALRGSPAIESGTQERSHGRRLSPVYAAGHSGSQAELVCRLSGSGTARAEGPGG